MIEFATTTTNRILPWIVLLSLLVSVKGYAQDSEDFHPPSIIPDRIVLSLTQYPTSEIGVNWRTSSTVTGSSVEIAKADASPNLAEGVRSYPADYSGFRTEFDTAHHHGVIIKELNSDTQYMYRVGDTTSMAWSEWSHFRTAKREGGFSFLYLGDAQNDLKSMWSRAIRGAYSKRPDTDFIFHAGDLVDAANSDAEWGDWFYAGGWIHNSVPTLACTGNHEYARRQDGSYDLSEFWQRTFSFPTNGPKGLDETTFYIDYQNTRFIALNTQAFLTDPTAAERQTRWLKSTLKNHEQKWTIVLMHHPIYSSKSGRDNLQMREAFLPLFEKHNVDLVLQGHDHTYARGTSEPMAQGQNVLDGPMFVVSVSGPKMYDLSLEEWMARGAADVQLYQELDVGPTSIAFKAYLVTGELYDAFELHKMNDGRKIFVDQTPEDQPELLEVPVRMRDKLTGEDWKRYKDRFAKYKQRKKNN